MRKSSAFAWLPRPQFRLRTLLMLPVIFALVVAAWRWPRTYHESSTEEAEIPAGVDYGSVTPWAATRPSNVKWPEIANVCRLAWDNFRLRMDEDVLPSEFQVAFKAVFDWRFNKKLQGRCRLTDSLGQLVAEGSFDQDLPHGKWTIWNRRYGDWRLEGEFDRGWAIGVWTATLADDLVVREFDVSQPSSDGERANPVIMTERIGGKRFELHSHSVKGHHRRGFDANGNVISEEFFKWPLFEGLQIDTHAVHTDSVGLYSNGTSRYKEAFSGELLTVWKAEMFDQRGVPRGVYRLSPAGIELLLQKLPGTVYQVKNYTEIGYRVYLKLPNPTVRRLAALWAIQTQQPIVVHPEVKDREWRHIRFDQSDEVPDWMALEVLCAMLEQKGLGFHDRFGLMWLTTISERDRWMDQTGVSEIDRLQSAAATANADAPPRSCFLDGGLTLAETIRRLHLRGSLPIEIRAMKELDSTVSSPYGLDALSLPDALAAR